MQHASLYAAALLTGTLIAACASSDQGPGPDTQPAQSAPATEPAPSGNGNGSKSPDKPECTSVKCTKDSDCTSACGGSGALGCCDTATKQCFKSSGATCPPPPATPDDAGSAPAY